jgi:hypothetical protein
MMMSQIVKSDMITKMVCKDKTLNANSPIEESIDLVGNVVRVQIFATHTGTDATKAIQQRVTNIFLEPNGLTPAIDINGQDGMAIMKDKYPGESRKYTHDVIDSLFLDFNFTDYAGKLNLSIPKTAKTMIFRMTATETEDIKVTMLIIQDMSLESSDGYRKYYSKTKKIEKTAMGQVESMALPFSGILESVWMVYKPAEVEFDDIEVEKNDDKKPYLSTVEMAMMEHNLRNDEQLVDGGELITSDFEEGVRYLELEMRRPVDANAAKSLRFNGKIKSIYSPTGDYMLKAFYEYVHLL